VDNKYRERNDEPVFRAQIETYKYYQRKVELLDEIFNNQNFFF
jgi:polyphosphate kinase